MLHIFYIKFHHEQDAKQFHDIYNEEVKKQVKEHHGGSAVLLALEGCHDSYKNSISLATVLDLDSNDMDRNSKPNIVGGSVGLTHGVAVGSAHGVAVGLKARWPILRHHSH
jgi:hypothetical protein